MLLLHKPHHPSYQLIFFSQEKHIILYFIIQIYSNKITDKDSLLISYIPNTNAKQETECVCVCNQTRTPGSETPT